MTWDFSQIVIIFSSVIPVNFWYFSNLDQTVSSRRCSVGIFFAWANAKNITKRKNLILAFTFLDIYRTFDLLYIALISRAFQFWSNRNHLWSYLWLKSCYFEVSDVISSGNIHINYIKCWATVKLSKKSIWMWTFISRSKNQDVEFYPTQIPFCPFIVDFP